MPGPETLPAAAFCDGPAVAGATHRRTRARTRLPGPQGLAVMGSAVAASRIGLQPISDNSTLVHLRTGIELLRSAHVPGRDPYSYTAARHPWVVQSWLASLLYGLADAVGHHALVFEQGLIMGVLGAVVAVTARSSTAWRTSLAATVAIAASAPGWSPRPLMLGLVCLALTILVTEREAHPMWLVPVVWLWVNTHGSYPLGLAWLGARALGEAIDVGGWPRPTLRRAGGFLAGLAVSTVNPVGWRLLTFPLVAVQRRSTFAGIVEWHSPNFQDAGSFVALVFMCAALVVLLRASLPWAQVLPVCGFLALGLVAVRNLAPFGVVLAPALAFALSSPAPARYGRPRPIPRPWADRAVTIGRSVIFRAAAAGATAVVAAGFVVLAVGRPTLDLRTYPVAAVDHLVRTGRLGPAHRIAAADVVGCYLIWRAGPVTKVFIDDRYDMYPRSVVDDARLLAQGQAGARAVLDHRGVDTVVWAQGAPLVARLLAKGGWRQDYDDGAWIVLVRDPSPAPSG